MARGDVDLVHPVPISGCLAKNCAAVALERDPSDEEPILLRMAPERDGNRVADRDPRWQTDVVMGPAGAGNKPIPTFGQHPGAMRMHRFDSIGGGDAEADGHHEACKPPQNCHQRSPLGNDMLSLTPPS